MKSVKLVLPCLLAAAALLPAPAFAQSSAAPEAPAAAENWASFTPSEGGFTMLMPGTPTRKVNEITEGAGAPGRTVLFTGTGTGSAFIVGWADYAPGFQFDDQAELAANRDNFVNGVQGKLLANRAITLNGAPGIEFDVEKPGAWIGRVRVYIIGRRPYQLIALQGGTTLDTAKIGRFLDSFKVVPMR